MNFQTRFNGIFLCQSFPHLLRPTGLSNVIWKSLMLDAVLPDWHYNQQSYPSEWLFLSVQSPTHANVITMERIQPWHGRRMFPTLGTLKGSCKGMLQQLLCCQHSANISLERSFLAESLLKDVGQQLSGEKCPCTILAKRCYCRPLKRTCSHCNTVHLHHF